MAFVYTSEDIQRMNVTNIWKNSIHIYKPNNHNKKQQYELHATGYCDLNGRKYVALRKETDATDPKIREKLNIM